MVGIVYIQGVGFYFFLYMDIRVYVCMILLQVMMKTEESFFSAQSTQFSPVEKEKKINVFFL